MNIDTGNRMGNVSGQNYSDNVSRTDVGKMRPATEPAKEIKPAATKDAQLLTNQQNGTEIKTVPENDQKKLKDAVEHVNQSIRHSKTRCEFSYHEETKRVSIKVIDEETDEIIREIPPEETLEMLSKMWELAGIMVDEKR